MSNSYDVVFRGDIKPGQNLFEVKQRVAQLFKLDDERIASLFSGRVAYLKRDADLETAERYQRAMDSAGAIVEVKAAAGQKPKPEPAAAPVEDVSSSGEQEQSPETPDSGHEEPEQNAGESEDGWSLAPVGADVLKDSERESKTPVEVSVDHLDLTPEGTPVLREDERQEVEAPDIDTSHLDLEKP